MNSAVRRTVACVFIFLPAIWIWLAAPAYDGSNRRDSNLPGKLSGSGYDPARDPNIPTLEECLGAPGLLANTYREYGYDLPISMGSAEMDEVRFLHGLYVIDATKKALTIEWKRALKRAEYYRALVSLVGVFKNSCLKATWMIFRAPSVCMLHATLGIVFLFLGLCVQNFVDQHDGE